MTDVSMTRDGSQGACSRFLRSNRTRLTGKGWSACHSGRSCHSPGAHMNRYAAILCLLPLAAPAVCESAVYKCTAEDGKPVYQDTPCAGGQLKVALVASPAGRAQLDG